MLSRLKFWESEDNILFSEDTQLRQKSEITKIEENGIDVKNEEDLLSKVESNEIIAEEKIIDTTVSKEKKYAIDDSQSMSSSVKEDIIKSLPDESDPKYFELLLEKIGF